MATDLDDLIATILAMNETQRAYYKAGFDDGYERGFIDGKRIGLEEAQEKQQEEQAKAREALLESGFRA